jgi:hypothetical protein
MQYLRDNAGVLESSANGTDWTPVQLSGLIPEQIGNPVDIGELSLRDNSGSLEMSDDGETWYEFYFKDTNLSLIDNSFYPPATTGPTPPTAWSGSLAIWNDTTNSKTWLMYVYGETVMSVELTPHV